MLSRSINISRAITIAVTCEMMAADSCSGQVVNGVTSYCGKRAWSCHIKSSSAKSSRDVKLALVFRPGMMADHHPIVYPYPCCGEMFQLVHTRTSTSSSLTLPSPHPKPMPQTPHPNAFPSLKEPPTGRPQIHREMTSHGVGKGQGDKTQKKEGRGTPHSMIMRLPHKNNRKDNLFIPFNSAAFIVLPGI